jgi:hypothetical protein
MTLRSQPGVETLFLRTDPDFPRFRMEMFCEPETKTIVVTPHAISDFATFIEPDGEIRQLPMGGETTDRSYYEKGIWYTVAGGDFLSIDISRGEILTRTPCCGTDTFYLHRLPGSDTFYVSQAPEREENFVEIRLEDGETPSVRLAAYEGYEYVPVEDGRLLISAKDFVAWADPETGHPLRLAELDRWGIFNEVTYDQANGVIYAPDGHRGVVHVLEAETLKNLGQFDASPGVRGILLDPANPKRVFSFNYASGEVREHQMPSGKTLRTWSLGPILRSLRWDCNRDALLGATSQGGYRIWLNMASRGR